MFALLHLLFALIIDCFKSQRRLEIENLYLRHQLNIAMRKAPRRLRLCGADRALLVWMTRRWPSLLSLSRVVRPDTILRWHRAGFRIYWRWKSRSRSGRPKISSELRELIRRMSRDNRLWGAPRIHGELLKLGFEVAESTVSKYMIRRHGPPSQTRLIGTLRRECLDHVLILGEWHLRRILKSYSLYYNETRTHLGLDKDTPLPRPTQRTGTIVNTPILSGLHHCYART